MGTVQLERREIISSEKTEYATGALSVAVVIPARNEMERLPSVLRSFPTQLPGVNRVKVIVVDDGSSDKTGEVARESGATVIRHSVSLGKGGALRTGCDFAVSQGVDVVVMMDADGQHLASDIASMLAPVIVGGADVVLGARQIGGQMPSTMKAGNIALNFLLHRLFGVSVRDSQSGFRAFRSATYPQLRWTARDYAVEMDFLIRANTAGLRVVEVPIATVYHDRYKGTQPTDGFKILHQLLRWRLG